MSCPALKAEEGWIDTCSLHYTHCIDNPKHTGHREKLFHFSARVVVIVLYKIPFD